jgi:hypothetical protein
MIPGVFNLARFIGSCSAALTGEAVMDGPGLRRKFLASR